jgi:serine O-acetyltransferase
MDSTDTVHQRGTYDGNSFRTKKTHLLTKGDEVSARLTRAVWDKDHFDESQSSVNLNGGKQNAEVLDILNEEVKETVTTYEQIDMSVPHSVYSIPTVDNVGIDLVWDLMRYEAKVEAAREPLLVSFLYSTILNHQSLESALAFHLANRLSNPAMLSTQIMSLIREALDADPDFRRSLRADILAVRDRDPACNCLPDVFLYFKGFHALQTYRVSHYLWKCGRRVLAHYLQSQVSQFFQIDIHPNATLGSGIMLDHGTGIVIGETAHLGHNCSVLHHVTLGGSGKKGVDRHPKVGNGVLLGAGASVLGNINIGDGCQVGAGTLVIEDLPPRSVAVGVPAKIIGRFVDVTAQPSIGMNQLGSKESDESIEFNI